MVDTTSAAPSGVPAPDPGADDAAAVGPVRSSRSGRDRGHVHPGRRRHVRLRYTDQEYTAVATAARAAGLTTTGYVADAAFAAATGHELPSAAPWRAALLELIDARTQVRRIGVNINQAARTINASGETPVWLQHALTVADQSLTRLDDAAGGVAALAGYDRSRTRPQPRLPTASRSGPDPAPTRSPL